MTSIDGYLRALASQLRWRRVGEDAVGTILTSVAATCAESGVPPSTQFGSPAEYAQTFTKGKALSFGFLVGNALAGVALLAGFTRSVTSIGSGGSGLVQPVANLVTTIALVIAAILFGQLIDRRWPRSFRR
jgi:hypothetical protein